MRIALAQINTTVGDLDGNVRKIIQYMDQAREADVDIVTFPELAISGYPPEDLMLKPGFLRDNRAALEEVIHKSQNIVALVGFADAIKKDVYNAAAVINDGRLAGIYHKAELPNYGVFDEKRYFLSGSECSSLFEMNGVLFTVSICEDVWIEGSISELCAIGDNAKIVLNISASPFHAGKLNERQDILASFARRTKAYVCYNNLIGGQDELVFDGGSLVVTPQGEVIARAKRFEEDFLVVDIELDEERDDFKSPPPPLPKGEKNIRSVRLKSGKLPHRDKITACCAPELGRLEEVYKALVLGTRDYMAKNRFGKAVIGLSGGIDSSLTAVIAVDALGVENVTGVTMPSQYTSTETRSDAEILAKNLNIKFMTIPIKPIFNTYAEALQEAFGEGKPGIEMENLQARIRGNILMALSNKFGWLVLTTGNKSETAVGYCTLYGDMAGGFAVIKDVPKVLVYELSEYVNKSREIIPASVIERPPTAELRPDQKDEDSLPPYAILDPILQAYVEEDKSPDQIIANGFNAKTVREVARMVDRSEYKRRQAPPGIKITPKAFGKDRRLPITNRYVPKI